MSLLLKAIRFASEVHEGQTRKGKRTPYIVHPLGVALLLQKAGADQTTVIAGILHDTIEDCVPYGTVTKGTLSKEFSPGIAALVDHVTEQDKTLSWEERKQRARAHIRKMPKEALLLKTADVLYNVTDKLEEYKQRGEQMFVHFNAPKEKQLEHTADVITKLAQAWPENPLLATLQATFKEYHEVVQS